MAAVLVIGVNAFGGQKTPIQAIESLTTAQQAFKDAEAAYNGVSGPGIDLISNDPKRALELLTTAYQKLAEAEKAGYPTDKVSALRAKITVGLDTLYRVVKVASAPLFTFPADTTVSLTGLVRGADGAPYVLDAANKTVWRIDLAKRSATPILAADDKIAGVKVGIPRLITTGGPDVLVLDDKNQLWRWRPVDAKGNGTIVKIKVTGATSWGNDILDIATFVANFDAALYKLYVVDPSEQNIMVLSPANDGSGYPMKPSSRLPTNRPVDGITDIVLDGDIFVAENGAVARVIPAAGWSAQLPRDTAVRPTSRYVLLSSPDKPDGQSSRRDGALYAYDKTNHRIVAFNKLDGSYIVQYQLAYGEAGWSDLQGMVVLPAATTDAPPVMWWISGTGLQAVTFEAVADPNTKPTASPSPAPAPTATPKPTKTPKPRKTPKP